MDNTEKVKAGMAEAMRNVVKMQMQNEPLGVLLAQLVQMQWVIVGELLETNAHLAKLVDQATSSTSSEGKITQ